MIRVACSFDTSLKNFDPANVQHAGQYVLLENLYTPFLLKNKEGLLIPGAASQFRWVDDEIEFQFRDDLVDSEGIKLTVDDAYFSLMRLMVLGSSTHGDLQQLLCTKKRPTSVSDSCDGIRVVDGKLRLKPKTRNSTIFENFHSIDFSIVPKRSVAPSDLRKIDLSITSGPYYIQQRHENGDLDLAANRQHFLYSKDMPQTARFIRTERLNKSEMEAFSDGDIDVLGPLDDSSVSEKLSKYEGSNEVSVFQTVPVDLLLLAFTKRGLLLPAEARWDIGRKVGQFIEKQYAGSKGYTPAAQYFPDGGQGSLSPDQIGRLLKLREPKAASAPLADGLILGLRPKDYADDLSSYRKQFPNLEIKKLKMLPAFDPDSDKPGFPHFYIVSTDTGFLESLPNVVNSVKSGFLLPSQENWLDGYLNTPELEKRINLLKEAHAQSLFAPIIFPIVRRPYVALYRSPWKPNFSFYFPNSPLWKISKK